jgi:hypothetical protein
MSALMASSGTDVLSASGVLNFSFFLLSPITQARTHLDASCITCTLTPRRISGSRRVIPLGSLGATYQRGSDA